MLTGMSWREMSRQLNVNNTVISCLIHKHAQTQKVRHFRVWLVQGHLMFLTIEVWNAFPYDSQLSTGEFYDTSEECITECWPVHVYCLKEAEHIWDAGLKVKCKVLTDWTFSFSITFQYLFQSPAINFPKFYKQAEWRVDW